MDFKQSYKQKRESHCDSRFNYEEDHYYFPSTTIRLVTVPLALLSVYI